jgi:hypothetical protein
MRENKVIQLQTIVLLTIFTFLFSLSTYGQKIKLLEGNFTALKGQQSFDLKFTYDHMIIGENTPEEKFLEKKEHDWNLKEQERGKAFVTQWYVDREGLYEPAFVDEFEGNSKIRTLEKEAKYTLIVKTTRTEGGWDGGVMTHPGEIDGELWIVESGNESSVPVKIGFYGIYGKVSNGGDFEMTTRIESAYKSAGRLLGMYLQRKIK